MGDLKDFLKDMGLTPVHPKPITEKPYYFEQGYFVDPRDKNGEVGF